MTEFIDAGGQRIAFERSGHGQALVLMHGGEASRQMFAALVPRLAPHLSVIAYDQRDCGDSTGPDDAAGPALADLADDARRLIQSLGLQRAHVFGSSFGGRVAQALAILHPQAVDRLVLGSTWPLPQSYAQATPDAARLAELRRGLPGTAAELAGWFFPEPFLQQRPDLRQVFAASRPETDRSRRRAAVLASGLERSAAEITAPTLVVAGALDRVVPAPVTQAMAVLIPGAEAVLLPGVGHATALQAPEALAEHMLRFLGAEVGR